MKQPEFLFIITNPFSGSTALAMILNSSPYSMVLTEKAEGQWLVTSLCDDDRWNPDKAVDWDLVARTWYQRYQAVNQLVGTIDVIIEKSPPNMVRLDKLLTVFPNSQCLSFIRNPYASCSSHLFRRYSLESLDVNDREKRVAELASAWLVRSGYIRRAIDDMHLLNFTYEDFCAKTEECIVRILALCPELGTVDYSAEIRVKDYPAQGISNHNSRQIGHLIDSDIDCITKVLGTNPDLLEYFGYTLL